MFSFHGNQDKRFKQATAIKAPICYFFKLENKIEKYF